MTGPPPRRPGRPRKWADEAERSRAYRARRADELADPSRLRDELRAARAAASQAATTADQAQRDAQRWQRRAETAQARAEQLTSRLQAAGETIRALRAERDQSRLALADKLSYAGNARALRDDPDSLLALVAELRIELADTHQELAFLRDVFNAAGNPAP